MSRRPGEAQSDPADSNLIYVLAMNGQENIQQIIEAMPYHATAEIAKCIYGLPYAYDIDDYIELNLPYI